MKLSKWYPMAVILSICLMFYASWFTGYDEMIWTKTNLSKEFNIVIPYTAEVEQIFYDYGWGDGESYIIYDLKKTDISDFFNQKGFDSWTSTPIMEEEFLEEYSAIQSDGFPTNITDGYYYLYTEQNSPTSNITTKVLFGLIDNETKKLYLYKYVL